MIAREVTDPKGSNNGPVDVGVVEEEGKFYRDRDNMWMAGIPEQYLGCTSMMFGADGQGGVDVQWTFGIDRPAYVYIAFDSRFSRPEERDQDPKDWFDDGFTDTGEVMLLDPFGIDYWIYKSNEPYPEGTVTLHGIEDADNVFWVMFVEEGKGAAVSPQEKLATKWGEIKSLK